jgi:hypothetical protein
MPQYQIPILLINGNRGFENARDGREKRIYYLLKYYGLMASDGV